jgi:hypothetical protein
VYQFGAVPRKLASFGFFRRSNLNIGARNFLAIFSRLKLETMHRAFSAKLPQQPIFGAMIFRRALGNVHFEATKMFVMLLPK